MAKVLDEISGQSPENTETGLASAEKGDKDKKENKKISRAKKKRTIRQIPQGRAYVHASYNNTMITLSDPNGNVIGWSSAGHMGFRGPKKATPYAASVIVKDVVEKCKAYGLRDVAVFVTGVGSGRDAAVRALNANGLNVLSIKDLTPIPHNGCRPPRARRI